MIVGFQGAPGAFSDDAARGLGAIVTRGYANFEDLLVALDRDDVPYALLPWENTTIGPVVEAQRAFARHSGLRVVAEAVERIEQCIVGLEGAAIERVREVRSHPAALAQCRSFFATRGHLRPVEVYDTAGAVEIIVKARDPACAAIASARAAGRYRAAVLARGVQDHPDNATRFLLLKKGGPSTT